MSARTYNLRVRTGAGVATQASQDIPPARSPVPLPTDVVIRPVTGSDPDSGVVITSRTYSDVVASRPPSPRRERPSSPSAESSISSEDSLSAPKPVDSIHPSETNTPGNAPPFFEETGNSDNPESDDESPWTTVQRSRAHGSSKQEKQKLTTEQAHSVKTAMEGMTAAQKLALLRRQEKLRLRKNSSASSREEGPSRTKGKGRDLLNWGGMNISLESLDVEAQAAALKSFKRTTVDVTTNPSKGKSNHRQKKGRDSEQRSTHRSHTLARPRHASRPAETQPSAQIAPKSYLGTALHRVER
jgi:hypothetical protein